MNQMMMFLALRGGNMDPARLQAMVQADNEKRRKIFVKLADLFFGLVMFFWGDLVLNAQTPDGKTVDITDPTNAALVSTDTKINALLAGLKQTNKGNLLREVLRPLLMDAAEFIAQMMEPDSMSMGLLSGGFGNLGGMGGAAGTTVHVNTAPTAASTSPAATTPVSSAFEGQFLQGNDGSKEVYQIVSGQKRWVSSEAAMNRLGNQLVNGRWTNTQYVSPSILAQFPSGPSIS